MALNEEQQQKVDNLVTAIDNKTKTSSDLRINAFLVALADEIRKE